MFVIKTVKDAQYASKEELFYNWKWLEQGDHYSSDVITEMAFQMTLRGL